MHMKLHLMTAIWSFASLFAAAQASGRQSDIPNNTYAKSQDSRIVLLEEFTSQYCSNCPFSQEILHEKIKKYDDRIVVVAHHAGYLSDQFSVKESWDCCWFYGTSNGYAPAIMIDRTPIGSNNIPVFHPDNLTTDLIEQTLQKPAGVSLNIESSYNANSRKLKVKVWGRATEHLTADNPCLTVLITESGYKATQNGGDSDFVHNNFPRVFLSEEFPGDPISLNSNLYFSKEYNYTIPLSYKAYDNKTGEKTNNKTEAHPENMEIIAFVSNKDPEDISNCGVENAIKVKLGMNAVTMEEKENPSFSIQITNGQVDLKGAYKDYTIYNLTGYPIHGINIPQGVYLIKIIDLQNRPHVRKVVIQ